jgi:hypothetical protein
MPQKTNQNPVSTSQQDQTAKNFPSPASNEQNIMSFLSALVNNDLKKTLAQSSPQFFGSNAVLNDEMIAPQKIPTIMNSRHGQNRFILFPRKEFSYSIR